MDWLWWTRDNSTISAVVSFGTGHGGSIPPSTGYQCTWFWWPQNWIGLRQKTQNLIKNPHKGLCAHREWSAKAGTEYSLGYESLNGNFNSFTPGFLSEILIPKREHHISLGKAFFTYCADWVLVVMINLSFKTNVGKKTVHMNFSKLSFNNHISVDYSYIPTTPDIV